MIKEKTIKPVKSAGGKLNVQILNTMGEREKIEVMVAKLCETGDTSWGNELQGIYDSMISELAKGATRIKELEDAIETTITVSSAT